jgi:hypothetical protein
MPRGRRTTQIDSISKRDEKLWNDYQSGVSIHDMKEIYGITRQRIYAIITRLSRILEQRPKRRRSEKLDIPDDLLTKYKAGIIGVRGITKALKAAGNYVSFYMVKETLKSMGINKGRRILVIKDEDIDDYKKGVLKTKDLAQKYGFKTITVIRALRSQGLPIMQKGCWKRTKKLVFPRYNVTDEDARAYEKKKETTITLAVKYGCAPQTIGASLRRKGVKLRPSGFGFK